MSLSPLNTLLVAAQRLERIDAADRALKSAGAYFSDAGLGQAALQAALQHLETERGHARDTFDRLRAEFEPPKMQHVFTYQGQEAEIPDAFRVEGSISYGGETSFVFKDNASGLPVATVMHKRDGWYVCKGDKCLNKEPFTHPINAIRYAAQELI